MMDFTKGKDSPKAAAAANSKVENTNCVDGTKTQKSEGYLSKYARKIQNETPLQREERLERERLRSAARRAKRKQDPVAYEEYCVKERIRNQLRKQKGKELKFKNAQNLNKTEQSDRKQKQNEWSRKSRAKKSANANANSKQNDLPDLQTTEPTTTTTTTTSLLPTPSANGAIGGQLDLKCEYNEDDYKYIQWAQKSREGQSANITTNQYHLQALQAAQPTTSLLTTTGVHAGNIRPIQLDELHLKYEYKVEGYDGYNQ